MEYDDDIDMHQLGEFPPVEAPSLITPDDRQYIDDVLELTGHELAGRINWNDEEHLHRLLTMGLIPQPRRSMARFVIDGWFGRNPGEGRE